MTDIKDLKRKYDYNFKPSEEYLNSMPDLQNNANKITRPIQKVGISGFKLPIKILQKDGKTQDIIASITGSVSLEASKRGINMSRILRTFYKSKDDIFDINKLINILKDYKKDLDSFSSHIIMNFEYCLWQESLRSINKETKQKEGGYQFYNITFDVSFSDKVDAVMWVDFVYSSACPCSTELSLHAATNRGIYGIPHSQRSKARIGIKFNPENYIWIEDVIDACREALTTEVLVFCKREDEQAFAELNGAQPKFVEDAIRLLAEKIDDIKNVEDYKIICSHLESLHAHNAISVLVKSDNSYFNEHVSCEEFNSLIC